VWSNNKFHSPPIAFVLASVVVLFFWSPNVLGSHGFLLSLSKSGMGPPPSAGIKSTMPCWALVLVRVSLLGNKILSRYVKCSVSYHGHVLECQVESSPSHRPAYSSRTSCSKRMGKCYGSVY
jgi:hypothetical protein